MIRTFIAIEVDSEVRLELAAVQKRLMAQFRSTGLQNAVRAVAIEHIHLTLAFLGDIEDSCLNPLAAALCDVVENRRANALHDRALPLGLAELGAFPNLKRPRIIWCGVGGAVEELVELQEAVTQAVEVWNTKPDDKPFHPHLTLFRIKTQERDQLRRIGDYVRESEVQNLVWPAREIKLFKSELQPAGPIYTTLSTVALV